jgi:purine-binding chemotaxis protein CheW
MNVSGVHVRLAVGSESYALPVAHVLEVAELGDVTQVPGAGPGVLGVRNLHGQVLPVFDLAHVLGVTSDDSPSRLVVATSAGRLAGLAVDAVTDVAVLHAELEPSDSAHLTHEGLVDGRLLGVVDVEGVYDSLGHGSA